MFDAFYNLETVEQRLKYLDDTFTPIVTEALIEFQNENKLQGIVHKDIFFTESNGYGAYYELVNGPVNIVRVMLYSDPSYYMQSYYLVHLYLPKHWPVNELTKAYQKKIY